MSNGKRPGRSLVIQLNSETIRVAFAAPGSDAQHPLQACASAPLPEGAVEDGFIMDREAVSAALKGILAAPEFKRTRRAVLTLCSTQIISESVTVPVTPARQLGRLLSANMDLYFPVAVEDYHMVWTPVGPVTDEEGNRQLSVQLWAVPRALLTQYYALANGCGLSVAAVDYCGASLAAAIGADYAAPRRKAEGAAGQDSGGRGLQKKEKSRQAEAEGGAGSRGGAAAAVLAREEPEQRSGEAQLYLLAEPEHLLMTFVQDGQVTLQRLLLRGGGTDEMNEAQMVLEYFNAREGGRSAVTEAFLCGTLAADNLYAGHLGLALSLPMQIWQCARGPEWCVCLGAARGRLDFGLPELNRVKGAEGQLEQIWQYALVLGGGVILTGALLFTFGSRTMWNTEISGMESARAALQAQLSQAGTGAADYQEYSKLYEDYSQDWDNLFQALRTYNNNLVLMLDELEQILPTNTSVTDIGIANEGMALQFACADKEESAYLLTALRKLRYADLGVVSGISIGPGNAVPAASMLPSLAEYQEALAQEQQEQSGGEETTAGQEQTPAVETSTPEPAPTEGSSLDLGELQDLLEQASQESGSTDYADLLQYALDNGLITRDDLLATLEDLTPEELEALEKAYGNPPSTSYTLDELLAKASFAQRKAALETMLNNDPIALYRFWLVFKEDVDRPVGTEILYGYIADDLWDSSLMDVVMSQGDADLDTVMPELLKILTKDNETLSATERLIRTDPALEKRYAYYLAVEMKMEEPDPDAGKLDEDKLLEDLVNGNAPDGPDKDKIQGIFDSIRDDVMPGTGGGVLTEDMLQKYLDALIEQKMQESDDVIQKYLEELLKGQTGTGTGQGGLDDLLNQWLPTLPGGTGTGSGTAQTADPNDKRIYFSVTLEYKQALIDAELERKGLSHDAKVEKLEVAP